MRLYYFTSAKHGLAAIRDQRYKLSTFDNLNDPFELIAIDLSNQRIRRAFDRQKESLSGEMALLCCSKSWSSTLLWSHYADRHRGVALELDVQDDCITHVHYQRTRTPMTLQEMEENMRLGDPRDISAKMLSAKSRDWSYEDEARIFHNIGHLQRPTDGLYFCPFNEKVALRGVILGPLCELSIKDIHGCMPPEGKMRVTKARIAFRSFRVTKDLSFAARQMVGHG